SLARSGVFKWSHRTAPPIRSFMGTRPFRKTYLNMMNTQFSGRDTAIDVIRALALLTIFVNHVPGNPLEFLTHKNFGFSDAAEAFVLISGVSAGLAYGPRFLSGQRLLTTLKAWRR